MDYFLSVFGTIISGVLVFVLGQIFIEFYLGPKKNLMNLEVKFLGLWFTMRMFILIREPLEICLNLVKKCRRN